jgi:hypothetical protein
MSLNSRSTVLALAAVVLLCIPAEGHAQDMPKEDYYTYVPLTYTRPVRQAAGSAALQLYGNPSDPSYRDEDPVDGIDDRRHAALQAMGVKFAPYLVLNTTAVPMDWKKFMNGRTSWPLYIDTWNQAVEGGELIREEQIDWLALEGSSCPDPPNAEVRTDIDDCRLLSLLREFDPEDPQSGYFSSAAIDPQMDPFKVLYWNFPGHDEASWTAEYRDPVSDELPQRYWSFPKVYLHPFIEEVRSNTGGLEGYELVLQYWLFYPWNDGGNNHEGDWEHINIIVAPKEAVGRPQTAEEILFMLNGGGETAASGDDYVVIKRVDYYFHEKVWTLDYASPNVYLPRDQWEAQFDALPQERIDQHQIWRQLRERAYEDSAQTVINTHVVGFVGADNKGTDQVLAAPGGKNRDSHGTYPFRGLYKNVGPAGASEHITAPFDYFDYFNGSRPGLEDGRVGRGGVIRFDRADRVEVVPDWERVHELLYEDPDVRREWSWLVLPIRWGYPAAESPFAGVISHASTGNLAPQTGSQNKGWNRSGAGSGFHDYNPHRYSGFFALGWQDGFRNTWGWLNLTFPTVAILPPLDIIVKAIGTPIALLTDQSPTYLQADEVPFRFAGLEAGAVGMVFPDAFTGMLTNREQVDDLLDALGYVLGDDIPVLSRDIQETTSPYVRVTLPVGRKFVSENTFWTHNAGMSGEVLDSDAQRAEITADIKLWEYAGSLRWNFGTGGFQPYGKLGYGWSWYRLEEVAVRGEFLPEPTSATINNFTWHYGLGLEWFLIRSFAPPPKGIDVGIRLEFTRQNHSLGLDQISDPVVLALGESAGGGVTREAVILGISLGF